MKIFTFLLSFILFPISVTSISAQDCTMGTAQDSIVTDHFKFVASTNSRITYENEYEHSFYTIGTWSAGLDAGGNLKGASSVYPSSSQNDYFPGPLLYDTDGTDSNLCLIWDRMFKVTEEEVNIFLDLFENNLLTEDNMPDAVKFWPSRGNPYMIEYQIEATGISADFIDVNFDGIYSPLLGDYPMLHQAAQMMYWVYNDGGGFHTLSFGKPLYQTIENYAFVYGNDPDEGMRNTLFHKVKKHNSSFNQYDKKYDGIYTDFKSRNLYTDKFGTLVDADAVYFFNNCWRYGNCNDSAYKDTIITLIKLIETPKNENDAAYGLTSTIYPFNFIGNPNVGPVLPIVEHYNLLRGLFQDGLPLTYGEDGYNTGNIDTVSFIYDDIHFDCIIS